MLISYTLRLTNNSITFLSTFLDKGKDNIWIKEIIDILYKIRWGWRAKDSGQWSNPSWPQHRPQLAPPPSPPPQGGAWYVRLPLLGCWQGSWKSSSLTEDVFFSHGGNLFLARRMSFSLTELTDLTEPICAQFRAHRTPPAYREHRGLSTKISCNVLCYRLTWCLCEPLCVLFFCVFLWEKERTHSMRWHTNNSLGRFFSHRTHRSNRTFLHTVSIPQNASGIQISQNISAIIITNKGHNEAYILFIGVSRWLRRVCQNWYILFLFFLYLVYDIIRYLLQLCC